MRHNDDDIGVRLQLIPLANACGERGSHSGLILPSIELVCLMMSKLYTAIQFWFERFYLFLKEHKTC